MRSLAGDGMSFAVVCAVLMGAGCPRSEYGFCEEKIKLQCAYEFRCCEDKERLEHTLQLNGFLVPNYVTSESECVDRFAGLLCSGQHQTDDSIAQGRQESDPEAEQTCIDDIQKAVDDCDIEDYLTARNESACSDTTNPLVDNKDDCATSDECKSGTCTIDRDKNGVAKDYDEDLAAAQGECADVPGKGDECPDFACSVDLFCDADGKCTELKDGGDSCDDDFQCKSEFCNDGKCDDNEVNLDKKFCEGRD
jgi:hypothetical protein